MVHINYANREEADEESHFVKSWCSRNNFNCYIRRIGEINRSQCTENALRDLYERYTRKVRFATYKNNNENPTVFIGHNSDDSFENILTNINKKSKYDNLVGMKVKSDLDGITFIRPMLGITKNDIFLYAKQHNIPFLKNSTSDYCQRGQIRTKILPVLETWSPTITKGFFEVSSILADFHNILDILIHSIISRSRDEIILLSLSELSMPILFWHKFFKIYTLKNISLKSLKSFVERLHSFIQNRTTKRFFEIKKGLRVCAMRQNTELFSIQVLFLKNK